MHKLQYLTKENYDSNNLGFVDGIKSFASLTIVIFHCFYFLKNILPQETMKSLLENFPWQLAWVWHGAKAVDVFFIISGFLVTLSFFRIVSKEINLAGTLSFYKRRISKILPLYIFSLLIFIPIEIHRWWPNIIFNLLFLNNFFPYNEMFAPHTWAITVEVQFYFSLPFLFLLFNYFPKKKISILGLFFLLSCLIRIYVLYLNPSLYKVSLYELIFIDSSNQEIFAESLYTNLYTRYGSFIIGIFIAILYQDYKGIVLKIIDSNIAYFCILFISSVMILFSIIIPVYLPSSYFNQNQSDIFNFFYITQHRNLFSLGIGGFFLLAMKPKRILKFFLNLLSSVYLRIISRLSYSIYLLHPIFIVIAAALIHGINADIKEVTTISVFLTALLAFLLTSLASIPLYLYIEVPFTNKKKKKPKKPNDNKH